MLTYLQAIILGLVQGITELFPISSLGHSVILPTLLGWQVNQSDPLFLDFLVATHVATALVLIGFYCADWLMIVRAVLKSFTKLGGGNADNGFKNFLAHDSYARLGWLIIIATIPAGLLGLLFQNKLSELFASPQIVAVVLVINGVVLWLLEMMKKNKISRDKKAAEAENQRVQAATVATGATVGASANAGVDIRLANLSWWQSFKIGLAECLALIPGFSRTGMAIGGGLLTDLDHIDAARFSFLLATPLIFAAGFLKLPALRHASHSALGPIIIGAIIAAVASYFSVRFLTRYFKTNTLKPFAIYCIAVGVIALIFLTF